MTKIKDDTIEYGSYAMNYHCSNCGESFQQWFKFGTRASQGECTNCGCAPEKRILFSGDYFREQLEDTTIL